MFVCIAIDKTRGYVDQESDFAIKMRTIIAEAVVLDENGMPVKNENTHWGDEETAQVPVEVVGEVVSPAPTMEVTVPSNAHPGATIRVQAAPGKMLDVIVPPGTVPGQVITIQVPP